MRMSQSKPRLSKLRKKILNKKSPPLPLLVIITIELADEQIGLNAAIPIENDTAISSQNAESNIAEPITDSGEVDQSEESSIPDNIEAYTAQSTDELTVQYNKGYNDGIEAGKNERGNRITREVFYTIKHT